MNLTSERKVSKPVIPGEPLDVALLFPALPPALDGIGDHTARLAHALTAHGRVRVFSAQHDYTPIPGVTVEVPFGTKRPQDVMAVVDAVAADPPDWLVVQFNQFSYGRWGFNPFLPLAIRQIKHRCPETRIAWLAHEDFVPVTNWKFALMTTWQRAQFIALGRLADLIFFSIETWAEKYGAWFPDTPVYHLPVGSNMVRAFEPRKEIRASLGLNERAFVAGVFGSLGPSRLLPLIRAGAEALAEATDDLVMMYVGSEGESIRAALPHIEVWDAGALPAADVARHLKAMDLHLCPFLDGVSTRRGSFMAGLQQGVPSVTNLGENTDGMLRASAGHAFVAIPSADEQVYAEAVLALLHDGEARSRIGRGGQELYDHAFTFEHIAKRFVAATTP